MNRKPLAERVAEARTRVCPKCHCEANTKCYSLGGANLTGRRGLATARRRMAGIHDERLALIPRDWTCRYCGKEVEADRTGHFWAIDLKDGHPLWCKEAPDNSHEVKVP